MVTKRYINLLPPLEQQELRILRINQQVRDFGIWLLFSLAVLITLFVAARFYLISELKQTTEELAAELDVLNNLETSDFRKEVERFNTELGNFELLQDKQKQLSGTLTEMAQKIPPDLTLDKFSVDTGTGRVEISGRGGSRSSVLAFRQSLLKSDRFKNVSFPLANLERSNDVVWRYRFFLK